MQRAIPLSAPDITEAEIAAVTAVLRTPYLSLGPELTGFEAALADYHSTEYALAVSSGTAGLYMALLTLDIGEGDEVIVPSFAFIAVANAVRQVGATPVFADIDPGTLNITAATVERVVSSRSRGVIVVHTFGIPADMVGLRGVAKRHNLVIVEDACEAIGAELNEQRVGSFGDLAVFGFYPNKQITTGEGGAVLAHSQAHAERLQKLRNQGRGVAGTAAGGVPEAGGGHSKHSDWLHHTEIGCNYRLSEMACALGRVQLGRLEEILGLRTEAAERYASLLSGVDGVELPPIDVPGCSVSWFVYVVRLAGDVDRSQVQQVLAGRGIASGTYFPPIHQQPAWSSFEQGVSALPVTESVGSRTLALPFFTRIGADEQERVAEALIEAVRNQKD
jgi:perosamine synthetase